MDVLDAADVVDRVNKHAAAERLALHVADQVPLVVRGVDPAVGIEHLHGEHCRVLAAHGDRIGISDRHVVRLLLRVVEHHALERAVGVERDEGRPVFASPALGDQERRTVVGRLGKSPVAEAVVGGDRLPDARQRDGRRHVQMPREEVRAAGGHDRAAAGLGRGLQCLLEGGRVVATPVAFGPKIPHIERAGNVLPPGRRAKQQHEQGQHRGNDPSHRRSLLLLPVYPPALAFTTGSSATWTRCERAGRTAHRQYRSILTLVANGRRSVRPCFCPFHIPSFSVSSAPASRLSVLEFSRGDPCNDCSVWRSWEF